MDSVDNSKRERAVFSLDRRINKLQTQTANHKAMANRGLQYAERRRVEEELVDQSAQNQIELESLIWARNKLLELA